MMISSGIPMRTKKGYFRWRTAPAFPLSLHLEAGGRFSRHENPSTLQDVLIFSRFYRYFVRIFFICWDHDLHIYMQAVFISSKSQYLQIFVIFQRLLKGTCVILLDFYQYYRIYMDIHNSFVHEVLIDWNVETGICVFLSLHSVCVHLNYPQLSSMSPKAVQ